MKGIIHIRIDDRLIHGQVATRWTTGLRATRIMIPNDEVAADDMQKNVLRMVAPPGVNTSIISKDVAAQNILAGKYDGQRVLIVVKTPADIVYLMDKGLEIKEINVGNMSTRPGTTQIKRSISVTDADVQGFKTLLDRGVNITSVMVPDESMSYIKDHLKAANLI